jgi:glucose-6-phosphate isomerase
MKYLDPTSTSAWQELSSLYQEVKSLHLRDLLKDNPQRVEGFTLEDPDLLLDYSKNLITEPVMAALLGLARECSLAEGIEAMFRGDPVNETEGRPALHTALRSNNIKSIR